MSAFLLLWREALLDALRRRLVLVIAAASLLSLLVLDGCTSCAPRFQVNGQEQELAALAPMMGGALLIVVGLWVVTLAGLLGSDLLAQSLEDGHAATSLARPVGRSTFALARLAGSLTVSLGAGALLLGSTTFWVATRHGLEPAPALLACLSAALACVTVAAFAMAASLALPRLAIWLLVFGLVFVTTIAFGVATFSAFQPSGEPPSSTLALALLLGALPAAAAEPWIGFAISANRDGYVPTHNDKFCQPLTGV